MRYYFYFVLIAVMTGGYFCPAETARELQNNDNTAWDVFLPEPESTGSPQEIIEHYSWLIDQGSLPANAMAEAYCRRADVYFSQGRLKEAMNDYKKAGAFAPHTLRPHMGRAQVYIARTDYMAAFSELRHARDLDVKETGLIAGAQALCYIQLGRFDDARKCIENALQENPDDARLYVIRNMLNESTDEEYKALFDLRKAEKLNPQWVAVYEEAMLSEGPEEDMPAVDIERDQSVDELRQLLVSTFEKQDYPTVVGHANELLGRVPEDKRARLYRARAFMNSGQKARAIPDLNHLLEVMPDSPRLLLLRARAYYASSQYELAIQDYRQVLSFHPENKDVQQELDKAIRAGGESD